MAHNPNPIILQDRDFTSGDSPFILDVKPFFNNQNASGISVANDGLGDITLQISKENSNFGDEIILEAGDVYEILHGSIEQIKLTHITDSSYRIIASQAEVHLSKGRIFTPETDKATLPTGIVLNTTTSTIISLPNPDRIGFYISNDNPLDMWIKFQAASVDNLKKGIFLPKNSIYEMPPEKYTGEVSAIADTAAITVFITEY